MKYKQIIKKMLKIMNIIIYINIKSEIFNQNELSSKLKNIIINIY